MNAVLEQMLILLPLALGGYISITLMRLPDLSLESSYLLGAAVSASLRGLGIDVLPCIVASLLAGLLVGLVVASLQEFGRLPYLLAAIVTNGLFHGGALYLLPQGVLATDAPLSMRMMLSITFGICMLYAFFLQTPAALCLFSYGRGRKALDALGVKRSSLCLFGLGLAGSLSGLSGALFSLTVGFVDVSLGVGVVLSCLMLLLLGKAALPLRLPSLCVPVFGVFLYMAVQLSLLHLGLDLRYYNAIQAFAVGGFILCSKKSAHELGI